MRTELASSQLYWNPKTLGAYFFREQSYTTFEALVNSVEDAETLFELIDETFESVDEFEEICYSETVEEIKLALGY